MAKMILIAVVSLVTVATACGASGTNETEDATEGLNGAWRLAKVEAIGPDGVRYPGNFQENLLLFSGNYYSMTMTGGASPAPYSTERFAPSDTEKIERYSRLIVNAGRFDTVAGVLTTWPEFALVPEYVGGIGEFDYELSGDTLDLIWRRIESADGVPDPNTAAGVRYHYKWVRD